MLGETALTTTHRDFQKVTIYSLCKIIMDHCDVDIANVITNILLL